ncbi:MAG: RNA polymerase sigma factor [Chloroflexota bacterium]
MGDEALAARVVLRDAAALALLYDRYAPAIYAMAAHMLGASEAEEAVQEVFLRLWNRAQQFDPSRGPFGAWFMAVARHHVLDEVRRRGQQQRILAAETIDRLLASAVDPQVNVEEEAWRHERGAVLRRALQALPDEQRRVLVLAYFGGLSQAAIAERLGCPLGTVKKRIRLGLQKLRAALPVEVAMAAAPTAESCEPDGGVTTHLGDGRPAAVPASSSDTATRGAGPPPVR